MRKTIMISLFFVLFLAFNITTALADSITDLYEFGSSNLISDESWENLIDVNTDPNTVDVGDRLRGIFRIDQLTNNNGLFNYRTLPAIPGWSDELTALFEVEVLTKSFDGTNWNWTFGPSPDFEAVFGTGAMIAVFEDPANNFTVVGAGLTVDQAEASASDGSMYWILGFLSLPGEGWSASAGTDDITALSNAPGAANAGIVNFGVNIIDRGVGPDVARITLSTFNGFVDVNGDGNFIAPPQTLETPFSVKDDVNATFVPIVIVESDCRVTAGGNKDGITIPCELKKNGMPDKQACVEDIEHTWGGQAGAQAGVDGNWTHHYKQSNKDSFVFHSNDLFNIECSDPGPFCEPARPADNRQIDFYGIGQFNNKRGILEGLPDGDLCFRVHLEDLGEPGRGGKWPVSVAEGIDCEHCPGTPVVNGDPSDLASRSDCRDCTDYYLIEIYDSADNDGTACIGDVIWVNGAPDVNRCDPGDPSLEGFFTRAGNVQMHPENN